VEKSALEAAKVDAEKKVKELDKQNQLLLDRLEGVHIVAAETERKAAGILSNSGQSSEAVGESDLQNVIRYLRRSKETVCFKTLVHIALYLFFSSPCRRQCFML
jgi:hypothetical protein